MKVFISWSGQTSERLGQELSSWIKKVLQVVDPYFSPQDIAKGKSWLESISGGLEESPFGILCITPDNLNSNWIHFEAGALSNRLKDAHVCPLLFDVKKADLTGPLSQIQATDFRKADILKLLKTINNKLENGKLNDHDLDDTFEMWWPKLEDKVAEILKDGTKKKATQRDQRDILEEILELTRSFGVKNSKKDGPHPEAIRDLLEGILNLYHIQTRSRTPKQDTLAELRRLVRPLEHIISRVGAENKSRDAMSEIMSLNFEPELLFRESHDPNVDDEIPF